MIEAAGYMSTAEVLAVGCHKHTLSRIRKGVVPATDDTIRMVSHALLVPTELALIALRRPWTGWRW
jgi:hypothetical protein